MAPELSIAEVYRHLIQCAEDATQPAWLSRLTTWTDVLQGFPRPDFEVNAVKANFPAALLEESGVLNATAGRGSKAALHASLCDAQQPFIPLSDAKSRVYDLLGPAGCVHHAGPPLLALLDDFHFREAYRANSVLFLVATIEEMAVLRSLDLAACTWFGLDRVTRDDLTVVSEALAELERPEEDYRLPQPIVWPRVAAGRVVPTPPQRVPAAPAVSPDATPGLHIVASHGPDLGTDGLDSLDGPHVTVASARLPTSERVVRDGTAVGAGPAAADIRDPGHPPPFPMEIHAGAAASPASSSPGGASASAVGTRNTTTGAPDGLGAGNDEDLLLGPGLRALLGLLPGRRQQAPGLGVPGQGDPAAGTALPEEEVSGDQPFGSAEFPWTTIVAWSPARCALGEPPGLVPEGCRWRFAARADQGPRQTDQLSGERFQSFVRHPWRSNVGGR